MKPIKLTESQASSLDAITHMEDGLAEMLRAVMAHYVEQSAKLRAKKRAWWDEIALVYDLEIGDSEYKVERRAGRAVLTKIEQDDPENENPD